jgi:hypothetical protein
MKKYRRKEQTWRKDERNNQEIKNKKEGNVEQTRK